MKNLDETASLKKAITILKLKQAEDLLQLKDQYYYTYESLKPVNIIKKAFGQMTTSSTLKGNILSNVIGITTGFLTKKILLGSAHNPIIRVLGTLLQFAITNVVTKNSENPRKKNLLNF